MFSGGGNSEIYYFTKTEIVTTYCSNADVAAVSHFFRN